jgi:hypothetical protein
VAGTEAVTDLLVLRRRTESPIAGDRPRWLDVESMPIGEGSVGINGYFHDHPEHILGELGLTHGLYGLTLTVTGASGRQLAEQMSTRLDPVIAAAVQRGRGLTATAAQAGPLQDFAAGLRTPAAEAATPVLKTLRYNGSAARFEEWAGFDWEPVKIPASRQAETRALLDLRDAAQEVLGGQQQGRDPAERAQLRRHLGALYDRYARTYGPINRFALVVPSDASQEVHDAKAADLQRAWRETMGEPGRPPSSLCRLDSQTQPEVSRQHVRVAADRVWFLGLAYADRLGSACGTQGWPVTDDESRRGERRRLWR